MTPLQAPLWRVGYHFAPLDFVPYELCSFNHRFDDAEHRFRTLYLSELPETGLREVLSDFRPNLAARARFVETYGPDAQADLPAPEVSAAWRSQHVLVSAAVDLSGHLVDLTDVTERQQVEDQQLELLIANDLSHLDLREITTHLRHVTQTIAGDLYDRGAAAIRFPSRLDGNACVAVFEGRATFTPIGDPQPMIDPAPEPLENVCGAWRLELEPAAAMAAAD